MAVIASPLSGLKGTTPLACSRVGAFQVRIRRPNTSGLLYLFANTFGCSRIASDCPSDTVHLSLVLHTGHWSLGVWMAFRITMQISFHGPVMGETHDLTAVWQRLHNSIATCDRMHVGDYSLATRYGRYEIKAITEGPVPRSRAP